jgi:hypothetical protein
MESSTLQKYQFREQSDGTMVGGFSIQNILSSSGFSQTEGVNRLDGLSVPAGLYSENNNKMSGGDAGIKINKTYGGTIEGEMFDKLYSRIAEHKVKTTKSATKKKK